MYVLIIEKVSLSNIHLRKKKPSPMVADAIYSMYILFAHMICCFFDFFILLLLYNICLIFIVLQFTTLYFTNWERVQNIFVII